uniref:Uncharacterized protein n=1 Tax=Glossina austeni TaxID=7395 RepID=A0A1A9V4Q2_GLOAU
MLNTLKHNIVHYERIWLISPFLCFWICIWFVNPFLGYKSTFLFGDSFLESVFELSSILRFFAGTSKSSSADATSPLPLSSRNSSTAITSSAKPTNISHLIKP